MINKYDTIEDILKFCNVPNITTYKESNLPAVIEKDELIAVAYGCGFNRIVTIEKGNGYNNEQCIHNKYGPAKIEFFTGDFNTYILISYCINNRLHRIGNPAFIRYKNGIIDKERYYIKSRLHNPVGPASRTLINQSWRNEFYINGHFLTLDSFIKMKGKNLTC